MLYSGKLCSWIKSLPEPTRLSNEDFSFQGKLLLWVISLGRSLNSKTVLAIVTAVDCSPELDNKLYS